MFDSAPTAVPQAPTSSQDAFLLDDLLAPAPAHPSSSPFHAFSTNVMPQGKLLNDWLSIPVRTVSNRER